MEELARVIQSFDGNSGKEEVEEMNSEVVDGDENCSISFEEFLNIMAMKKKVINQTINFFFLVY